MTNEFQVPLLDIVEKLGGSEATEWLGAARAQVADTEAPMPVIERIFPVTGRSLGTERVGESRTLDVSGSVVELKEWQAGDLGRAVLLIEAAKRAPSAEVVEPLFRHGDEVERAAIVRSLILLPASRTLKHVALEAGRANSVALFSAIALDNPYPERHYTDHEFNQLVLKAMFMGLPIGRIVGLAERANAELSRMCEDFYDERTAAGRPAPVDIWLAMLPHASERGRSLAIEHLAHRDPGHRFHAALAAARLAAEDSALTAELARRLELESDERVLRALQTANIE